MWRETEFWQEIKRRGKEELLNQLTKVEIPFGFASDESWLGLAEKWEWSILGDHVRKQIRMESTSG